MAGVGGAGAWPGAGAALLAALAVGLLVAVGVGLMLGPDATDPDAGAVAPVSSPTPAVVAVASPTQPSPTTPPTVLPPPTPAVTEAPPDPTAPPATKPPQPPPPPQPTAPPAPEPPPAEPPSRTSGPAQAVADFYAAVERHDWDTATNLWSPSMQERYPPEEWLIDRFRPTTRIDITRLETIARNRDAGTATVAVSLIEYRTTGLPRTFVGAWDLVRIDGRWLLNQPYF